MTSPTRGTPSNLVLVNSLVYLHTSKVCHCALESIVSVGSTANLTAAMTTALLCTLVALLQVELLVATSHSACPVFPGLPGRDGMPGPQGPPGTCACSELSNIVNSNTDLRNSLQESLQNLTNGMIEALGRIQQEVAQISAEEPLCPRSLGLSSYKPAKSCREILQCNPSAQSGYYWLKSITTESQEVYCAMDTTYCNITGGWIRLGYFNMSEPGISCPASLRQINTPTKLCGRRTAPGCSGVIFPTDGIRYSKVCGQARGYQYLSPDGFGHSSNNINTAYVEGIAITYGSPRHHLWTYAAGLSDDYNNGNNNCPCAKYPGRDPPDFVGMDYYCESGITGRWTDNRRIALEDPLWDGDGCGPGNNCCSQTGMPWFYRTLPQEVGDDVEVRLCGNQGIADEEVYAELVEIYVQ